MLDHALTVPHEEVCGILGARAQKLRTYYPVANAAKDQEKLFLLDAQGQIDAMRIMRDREENLGGIFHSHPDSGAEPSETDLRLAAYPGVIYFIASLAGGQPELRAFEFDGTAFHDVELEDE